MGKIVTDKFIVKDGITAWVTLLAQAKDKRKTVLNTAFFPLTSEIVKLKMALRHVSFEVQKFTEHTQSCLVGGEQKLFVLGSQEGPGELPQCSLLLCFVHLPAFPLWSSISDRRDIPKCRPWQWQLPRLSELCSPAAITQDGYWRLDTFSLKNTQERYPSWLCESSSKQPASNSPIESFGLTETSLGHIKTYRWICSSSWDSAGPPAPRQSYQDVLRNRTQHLTLCKAIKLEFLDHCQHFFSGPNPCIIHIWLRQKKEGKVHLFCL